MAKQRVKDEKRVDPRLIHQYLLDKGLSEEHALGMMANMKAESNFIAGKKEIGKGTGIGLFQHSGSRKPQMLAAINNDLQNWKGQIDFALSEADTKKYTAKKFTSPQEATEWFMKNWERPADQSQAKVKQRLTFFDNYKQGVYDNNSYIVPEDATSFIPTDIPTNTPDQLRITTLEEQNKQLAEDFKKAHEDLAQKEKLEKESSTVKELTKAEIDQQNKAKFWEAYSAPQEDVAQEKPQALPSANDLGLYTQNLGFDVQQAGQLFSTGQPEQQVFAEGGPVNNSIVSTQDNTQIDRDAMNAMMKSRMAISAEFGNPAAQRMSSPNPKTYTFTGEEGTDAPIGSQGTHFMASMGEYATPLLQDKGGNELEYNENPRPSSEDMKFRTPEEAQYFAEHYKEIAPMMRNFAEGGKTDKPNNYKIMPETFNYEGRPGARYRRDNYGNWLVADKNTDGKFVSVKDASGERQAELNRKAVSSETGKTVNEYAQKESKDPQKRFEQEVWNDYDKMSTSEKVLDRVQAGMVDPIGMASRFISGEQAYIPGMGKGLLNTESGEYQKYLKSVGYTPGKFEASDLQNILNPMYWGASAGNQLDKGNTAQGVLEAGLAFAGAGQGKNMLQGVKYLADDVVQGTRTLKNVSMPTYKNVYRVEPTTFAKDAADELSGRWMGSLEEMPYYVRNLKDPEAGIRIIRQKMPTKQWEAISGHNMPENAKLMSAGTGDYKTFQEAVNAGEISRDAGSRISNNAYTTSDMSELSSNPRLINLTEGVISDELANKLRYEQPRRFFPTRDLVEYPAGDLGKEGAMGHIFNVRGDVEKPILGIPRQYFPFREGGTQESLLDQNSIDAFKQKYGI